MNEQECKELIAKVTDELPENFRIGAVDRGHKLVDGEWVDDENGQWSFGIFMGQTMSCIKAINSPEAWDAFKVFALSFAEKHLTTVVQ